MEGWAQQTITHCHVQASCSLLSFHPQPHRPLDVLPAYHRRDHTITTVYWGLHLPALPSGLDWTGWSFRFRMWALGSPWLAIADWDCEPDNLVHWAHPLTAPDGTPDGNRCLQVLWPVWHNTCRELLNWPVKRVPTAGWLPPNCWSWVCTPQRRTSWCTLSLLLLDTCCPAQSMCLQSCFHHRTCSHMSNRRSHHRLIQWGAWPHSQPSHWGMPWCTVLNLAYNYSRERHSLLAVPQPKTMLD